MVNVQDFDDSVVPKPTDTEDKLTLIFNRQRELMVKYWEIEHKNGFYTPTYLPVNLHDRHVQHLLKDLAWRITEELTEATQALEDHPDNPDHFDEELADAYHFLVELMILTGTEFHLPEKNTSLGSDRLDEIFGQSTDQEVPPGVEELHYAIIQPLGNAMNCLKNKPWKTTHMLTDVPVFRVHILDAHTAFIDLLDYSDWTADKLMNMYFRKARVNQFRQESNY